MASTIKLKNSTTAGNTPTSLETGEVAINVADGNLFYGSASAVLQNFVVDELEVKGNLTAQQYIVSSSVTYTTQSFSSGSTAFGDSADDSHEFTGNITASGDISASGDIITTNLEVGNKITHIGDTDTYLQFAGANDFRIIAGGIDAVKATSSEIAFNDGQANYNFRVEGDSESNLIFADASADKVGIGTNTPGTELEVIGDISASGDIIGSNLSGTNTGDQDISKFVENAHTAMPLFKFKTSTNAALTPSSGEFLQVDAAFDYVAFNSQSLDGVDLAPAGINELIYNSPGTILTVIETGSGAYKSYRTNTVIAQTGDYIQFGLVALTANTHSSGSISNGDIVYLRVDQSTPTVEFQSAVALDRLFAPALDATFNYLDVRYTDDNIGSTGLNTTFDTTNTNIKILPAISKSADITIAGLTVNGNIAVTGTVDGTDVAQLKTDFDTLEGKALISSSAQISSDISGSFTADSASFSTRIAANETITAKALISSSVASGSILPNVHQNIFDTGSVVLDSPGAIGDIVKFGNSLTSAGALYYLTSTGQWAKARANNTTTGASAPLAIAVGSNSTTDGMCLRGFTKLAGAVSDASIGDQVFMSDNALGKITGSAPSDTGDVVRVVGHKYGTKLIYFNPSNDFIVHA